MIERLNHKNLKTAKEILDISLASYRKEAELIKSKHFPPLFETLTDISQNENIFLGFIKQNTLIGIIEIERYNNCYIIARLVVSPEHFRQGVANKLLSFICHKEKACFVTTSIKNKPAILLYKKHGFTETNRHEATKFAMQLVTLTNAPNATLHSN